jgi:competence protein ComEA
MGYIEPPTGLRERFVSLSGRRSEALIVVAVVAVAVIVSAGLMLRHQPAVIAPPATENKGHSASMAQVASPSPSVLVDVSGSVKRPGVYGVGDGARIEDAIQQAGGPLPKADLGALNLAQVVIDGQQIAVPRKGEVVEPVTAGTTGGTSTSTPAPGQMISLNSADEPTLETIPGVGPVTAQKIIDYRTTKGGFDSVEQLLDIDGIGPATLENIRPYVSP